MMPSNLSLINWIFLLLPSSLSILWISADSCSLEPFFNELLSWSLFVKLSLDIIWNLNLFFFFFFFYFCMFCNPYHVSLSLQPPGTRPVCPGLSPSCGWLNGSTTQTNMVSATSSRTKASACSSTREHISVFVTNASKYCLSSSIYWRCCANICFAWTCVIT